MEEHDVAPDADWESAFASASQEDLSEEYTETMQARMGDASLIYRHEAGMNYTRIWNNLIVGSCPQTPTDIQRLYEEEGVRVVLCLQEDSDLAYFGLELAPIVAQCTALGVTHLRRPVRDFDGHSLRLGLPRAVSALAAAMTRAGPGTTAYVHCTAGLGRAPATALAHAWWVRGEDLGVARTALTTLRPCSPRMPSIRAATLDLLTAARPLPVVLELRTGPCTRRVQVAGLHVGWGNRAQLTRRGLLTWSVRLDLPPGDYPYKFIIDGRWTLRADHDVIDDGNAVNNVLRVPWPDRSPQVGFVCSGFFEKWEK